MIEATGMAERAVCVVKITGGNVAFIGKWLVQLQKAERGFDEESTYSIDCGWFDTEAEAKTHASALKEILADIITLAQG